MSEIQNGEQPVLKYEKIGGWLIVVAFGLVVTPVRLLFFVIHDIVPVFSGEAWSILTTPGTEAYHPLWAPLLIFELVTNIAFSVFAIILSVFFFQRRMCAPRWMIVYLLSNAAFVGTDYFVGNMIPAITSQKDVESMTELARTAVAACIWVPYFLVSKRVKGTFLR